jgi:hypothetical protein
MEKFMKVCSVCKLNKPLEAFAKKRTKKNGEVVLQYHCRECQKLHSAKNYKKHQRKYINEAIKRKTVQREIILAYLLDYFSKHPCVDCGQTNPIVLEFDHVYGKKFDSVSSMIRRGFTLDEIVKEVNKCEVRCANCHRIVTAQRGNWMMLKYLP